MHRSLTCNCSVVEGEPGFFTDACGVGLRLRCLGDGWPDCGDNVCDAVGVVAVDDAAEWLFNDLRAAGGDLAFFID